MHTFCVNRDGHKNYPMRNYKVHISFRKYPTAGQYECNAQDE